MRLQRLTGLGAEARAREIRAASIESSGLRAILADSEVLLIGIAIVRQTRTSRPATGGRQAPRRNSRRRGRGGINLEDLEIQEEDMVVTISHAGYVKRTPTSTRLPPRRSAAARGHR